MQVFILGVGDLSLATEAETAHRHTMARIGVSGNSYAPLLTNKTVGGEDVCGSPYLSRACIQLFRGDIEV